MAIMSTSERCEAAGAEARITQKAAAVDAAAGGTANAAPRGLRPEERPSSLIRTAPPRDNG
jgi:hypothetical protein